MISEINKAVYRHIYSDRENKRGEGNIKVEDILELLVKQSARCYVCKQGLLIEDAPTYCCYKCSVDRIDNNLPHTRTNIILACAYCNCRYHSKYEVDKKKNKVCVNGCHTTPVYIDDVVITAHEKLRPIVEEYRLKDIPETSTNFTSLDSKEFELACRDYSNKVQNYPTYEEICDELKRVKTDMIKIKKPKQLTKRNKVFEDIAYQDKEPVPETHIFPWDRPNAHLYCNCGGIKGFGLSSMNNYAL